MAKSNVIRFPLSRVFEKSTAESFARALDIYCADTTREIDEMAARIEARKKQDAINEQAWKAMNFNELEEVPDKAS